MNTRNREIRERALEKTKTGKLAWFPLSNYIEELGKSSNSNAGLAQFMRKYGEPKTAIEKMIDGYSTLVRLQIEGSVMAELSASVKLFVLKMYFKYSALSPARIVLDMPMEEFKYVFAVQAKNSELVVDFRFDLEREQQALLKEIADSCREVIEDSILDAGLSELAEL